MKYLLPFLAFLLIACNPKIEENEPVTTTPPPKSARQVPLSAYSKSQISINDKTIDVYVADESAERTEGLKFTKEEELGADEGMIFVFPSAGQMSFWMENTLLPLDIAFLDSGGKILNIRQMQPLDTSPQPSEGAAQYAVEMHEGWFKKNAIEPGDKFDLRKL